MQASSALIAVVLVALSSTEARNIRNTYKTFKPILPPTYMNALDIKSVPEMKIVGGEPVEQGEIPFQADILYHGEQFCGGSILNENWVLSAAHCLNTNYHTFTVVAGEIDQEQNSGLEQRSKMKNWIKHPSFSSSTLDYDYSLIELDTPFNLDGKNVAAATLAKSRPADNSVATVSGWGTTSAGGEISNILLKTEVHVISQMECQEDYVAESITDRMICAGEPQGGQDSCQGDSGGPLFLSDSKEQFGIVSWGYGCADRGHPGVYSLVSAGLDWICGEVTGSVNGCN